MLSANMNTSERRSIITVPTSFSKGTSSLFRNAPHREISPSRGMAILARYPNISEWYVEDNLGLYPSGSISCIHRIDRLIKAATEHPQHIII